jgi:hypothetical protein
MTDERRAPVQAEYRSLSCDRPPKPAGTVSWEEHKTAWHKYDRRFHCGQTAERIAERGGFAYWEISEFLGHEPTTWRPR